MPVPSRRYLALRFPWLPTERLRATRDLPSPDAPLALFVKVRGSQRLSAVNAPAAALGLSAGLPLADARARIPGLAALPHDMQADAAFLERLADSCFRYTPSVGLDRPDGLILDIAGATHPYGGEPALAADASARFGRMGLAVAHAFGNTPDAARALARYGNGAAADDEGRALRALPVAALGLEADAEQALRRVGLMTIGEVASRPRASLASRFGEAAVTALMRLLGEAPSPLPPVAPGITIAAERRFAEPLGRVETALSVLDELCAEVGERLREQARGARRFRATLFRADGLAQTLRVETGLPVRDTGVVMRLFQERIQTLADPLDPGFGFDALRLEVFLTEPLGSVQLKLKGGDAADPADREARAAALVDRLSVRLGREAVRRLRPHDSHVPERAQLLLPALDPPPAEPASWPDRAAGEPPMRPLCLFDPPQRIDVVAEVPDGPPHRFRWKKRLHEVTRHEGPERIAGEWWRRKDGALKGTLSRDYYRVEDAQGRRFWLFRHGLYSETVQPAWYLHGLFA